MKIKVKPGSNPFMARVDAKNALNSVAYMIHPNDSPERVLKAVAEALGMEVDWGAPVKAKRFRK